MREEEVDRCPLSGSETTTFSSPLCWLGGKSCLFFLDVSGPREKGPLSLSRDFPSPFPSIRERGRGSIIRCCFLALFPDSLLIEGMADFFFFRGRSVHHFFLV